MSSNLDSQIKELIARLGDSDPNVRSNTVFVLGQIAQSNPNSQELFQVIQPLIQAFKDPDKVVSSNAVEALLKVDIRAIQFLTQALRGGDRRTIPMVAYVLGQIAQINPNSIEILKVIQPLIQASKDPNANVKINAIWALGQIIENIVYLQPSSQLALEIRSILDSKELTHLHSTNHNLYVQLFNACNEKLKECQIQMNGVQVEPPRRFARAQQGVRQRGKQHV